MASAKRLHMKLTEKEESHNLRVKELKLLFEQSKLNIPKFSLRKFSLSAKVDASTMSQYFRGKRYLSKYCYEIIIENLKRT
jgi:hypothetical protein